MTASNYLESKLINHVLGKAAYTMPGGVYVALFTADPGEEGSLDDEVPSGVGYARQLVTADMTASVDGSMSVNGSDHAFGPCANSDWGTLTHAALMDSGTIGAGNVLASVALNASRVVKVGDDYKMPAGEIKLSFE